MSYTETLQKEIDLYVERLEKFKAAFAETDSAVESTVKRINDEYDSEEEKNKPIKEAEIAETKKELQELKNEQDAFYALKNTMQNYSASVKSDIEKLVDELANLKNDESADAVIEKYDGRIQENYNNLNETRLKFVKLYSGNEVDAVERKLISRKNSLESDIDRLDFELQEGVIRDIPEEIYYKMSFENRIIVDKMFDYIPEVVISFASFKEQDYPNLMRLMTLVTMRSECADHATGLNDKMLSIVCNEHFDSLRRSVSWNASKYTANGFYDKAFEKNALSQCTIKSEDGKLQLVYMGETPNDNMLTISPKFLGRITRVIEEEQEINLPRLALRLYKDGGSDAQSAFAAYKPVQEYIQEIEEFMRLYEETPEERLITEQRYYQEKMLEEQREKNRILEEQIEDENRRYKELRKEEEYERRREERRREKEEYEREWRQRQDREDRRRREEEDRRREQERRRDEEMQRRRERQAELKRESEERRCEDINTRRQCNSCKCVGQCAMAYRRSNCASYIPK